MMQRGFTLLETIIYIALFSVLMSGVLITVYELLQGGTHNMQSVAIQEEGLFINRKLSWALSSASSVTTPNPQTLVIVRPDLGAQSPLTFSQIDGQMKIARGTGSAAPLTTSEFTVSNTQITIIPPTGGIPASIRVSYEIEGTPFVFKTYLHL